MCNRRQQNLHVAPHIPMLFSHVHQLSFACNFRTCLHAREYVLCIMSIVEAHARTSLCWADPCQTCQI
jgi:putative ribosome biogenesis GTPase RsgA